MDTCEKHPTACVNQFLSQAPVCDNKNFSGWSLHLVLQHIELD